jgi:hypothetical protein
MASESSPICVVEFMRRMLGASVATHIRRRVEHPPLRPARFRPISHPGGSGLNARQTARRRLAPTWTTGRRRAEPARRFCLCSRQSGRPACGLACQQRPRARPRDDRFAADGATQDAAGMRLLIAECRHELRCRQVPCLARQARLGISSFRQLVSRRRCRNRGSGAPTKASVAIGGVPTEE